MQSGVKPNDIYMIPKIFTSNEVSPNPMTTMDMFAAEWKLQFAIMGPWLLRISLVRLVTLPPGMHVKSLSQANVMIFCGKSPAIYLYV